MSKYKLSIICPVYNQEKLIRKAIKSCPIRDDVELIIVNDGSTDRTYYSVQAEIKRGKRNINFINLEENKGVATALNTGLEAVQGEYFVCLGSDDYFYTDVLNEYIDNWLDGTDMVYFNLKENDGLVIAPTEDTRWLWVGSTKAYRTAFVGDTRYPDGKRACEDLTFDKLVRDKQPTYKFSNMIVKHYNYPREGSLTDLANKGKIDKELLGK